MRGVGKEVDWNSHHRSERSSLDSQRRPSAETVCVCVCVLKWRRDGIAEEERRVGEIMIIHTHTHSDKKLRKEI